MERTLGPRDLGSILKETFTIYKNNFWRLVAIVSTVTAPFAIIGLIFNLLFIPAQAEATKAASRAFLLLPLELIASAAFVLMAGAIIYMVSEQHFNRPVSVGRAYSFSWRRTGAMFGAIILVFLIMVGVLLGAFLIALLMAAITRMHGPISVLILIAVLLSVYLASIYMTVRWAFVQQAALLEGCSPTTALPHSSELVNHSWWRVFGIMLVLFLILLAIELVFFLPAAIIMVQDVITGEIAATAYPPVWMLIWYSVGGLIFSIIAMPFFTIGQTLLYFDLRVRKQGYTLDNLAGELGLPGRDEATVSPPE